MKEQRTIALDSLQLYWVACPRLRLSHLTADKKGNQRFQSPSAASFIRKTLSEMPKPFHKKIAIGGDEYGI